MLDIEIIPTSIEANPSIYLMPQTQGKEETAMKMEQKKPILPLALRETEITEADVETMLRVARDKRATAGRYKRIPKRLPLAEMTVARK